MSSDTEIKVNNEECNLEERGVEMTVECSGSNNGISGLSEERLLNGSKNGMVFFFLISKEGYISAIYNKQRTL